MGGQNDLHIRIQLQTEINQAFLPLDVERYLWLIHKEHIWLVILYQHREQDGKYLLLTTRQLIRHQCLTDLRETDLVLRTYNLLARLREQVIDNILEALLLHRQLLGRIRITCLQLRDNTITDIHLIIEILTLQVKKLEVERRGDTGIDMRHRI